MIVTRNPTQVAFNEIHTEVMQKVLDNPGDESYAAALFELLRSYNYVCNALGWEIKHELGELD